MEGRSEAQSRPSQPLGRYLFLRGVGPPHRTLLQYGLPLRSCNCVGSRQDAEQAFALKYPAQAHPVSSIPADNTDQGLAPAYMPWGAAGKTDSVTEDTVPLPYCIRGVGILFDNVLTFGPKRLLLVLPVLLEFDHLHLGHHPDDRLSTSTFTISHHRDSTSCRHLAAQQMLKACFHLDSSYIEWTEISLQLRKIHRCNIL